MSFPPYPTYAQSDSKFIGRIPNHWKTKPLWASCSCNDEVLPEDTSDDAPIRYIEISDVTLLEGMSKGEEMLFGLAPSRARRRVRRGDVIVSTVRTYLRAIAQVDMDDPQLVVSTGFAVLRPRGVEPGYLRYVMASEEMIAEIISRSKGVSYPAINAGELMKLKAAFPPGPEQRLIGAFLDRETGKLDTLTAEQETLLLKLAEKRQATISRAVTQGTRPGVRLVATHAALLNAVPEHWTVQRLKFLAAGVTVGVVVMPSQYYADTGVPALRSLNVKAMAFDMTTLVHFDQGSHDALGKSELREGDVVAVRTGKPGVAAPVTAEVAGYNCIDLIIIRNSGRFDARFIAYVINSDVGRQQVALGSGGAIQQHFNIEEAANLVLAAPDLDEQKEVADHLDRVLAEIDSLATEAQANIDLLRERRAALISAAVTGRIDVRAAAASRDVARAA